MQGRQPDQGIDEREAAARLRLGDRQKRLRRFWRSIPSPPRCKMCHRPFAGPGGLIMRAVGLGRWPGNPKYCRACFKALYRDRAGAEIECSLLFADVRGSTSLAESMRPAEFRDLLERFYELALDVFVQHDAIVDKFVGDEVIGIFVPALTEANHAREAIDAGLDLLAAISDVDGNPIPVGVSVHTGIAYVGAVGTEDHVEFTALGDTVNIAARLASAAGPAELLVTETALGAAGLADRARALEHRQLNLRGKSRPVGVVVQTVAANIRDSPAGT
jgi:adenylate cyclase